MRGPPLGPLLPLLLILNTSPVNPESTEAPSALYKPTRNYAQRKVAENNNNNNNNNAQQKDEMTRGPTMITYHSSPGLNCTECSFGEELSRPVRSDSAPTYEPKSFKILSQILESANFSASPLEVDSLVRRNDSQMSSLGSVDVVVSSGSGDSKSVDSKRNASGLFPANARNNNNRSSSVQRLGRTDAPMLNYIFDTYSTLNKHHHRNDRYGGPRIESSVGKISVDTGAEAQLDCRVSSLQDKLVSWVRRRPEDDTLDLLTIGQQTYTADSRYVVDFRQPDNWRLVLNSAKSLDSGIYECQISTHPPLTSRLELVVNAPVVSIVEAGGRELRDKYYERNSTLKLACQIRHLAAHTPAVFWLHADRILNDDTLRGGVSVKTEAVDGGADSTLLVARLNSSDSGRYTCSVGTDLFAVVNVHVLNESLAELHQGAVSRISSPSSTHLILIAVAVVFIAENILGSILNGFVDFGNIGDQSSIVLSH